MNPDAPPTVQRRWQRFLPLLLIPTAICLVLSGVLTWLVDPSAAGFGGRWLRNFLGALPVLPVGLFVMDRLSRWLGPTLGRRSPLAMKLVLALITATVMETLIGSVVVLGRHGVTAQMPELVLQAALRALPVGLTIALLMAFVIRPRIVAWQSRLAAGA